MRRRQFLLAASCTVPVLSPSLPRVSATQPDYEPLGSVSVPGATEAVVGPDDRTAYVATQRGFAIVDISTPESPTVVDTRTGLLADRDNGPLREILDVKVAGDRLLVAGPANNQEGPSLEGFLLYDVTDPQAPEQVTFHETGHPIHNAFLTGDHAYLVDGDRVVVVDISDTPREVGSWQPEDMDSAWADVPPLLAFAHDLYVQDDRAYVVEWDAGTFVLDVSNPEEPEAITRIGGRSPETLASIPDGDVVYHSLEMPGNHHTVMVDEDAPLLVLNKEAWKAKTSERDVDPLGEVELWDISDESDPEKQATIDAPSSRDPTKDGINTTPHNFDIEGDRLYTSWYDGGVKIHDISDPTAPELLAWWRAPEQWTFWTVQYATEECFIASSHSRGQYNAGKGALVTFPNRPGEQSSPPPLASPAESTLPTPTPSPTPPEPTPTTSEPSPTTTRTREVNDEKTDVTRTDRESAEGSGFGVFVATGGAALAALIARFSGHNRNDD